MASSTDDYYPVTLETSNVIDYLATPPTSTATNALLPYVTWKYRRTIPGDMLLQWIQNLNDHYTTFTTHAKEYKKKLATYEEWASYRSFHENIKSGDCTYETWYVGVCQDKQENIRPPYDIGQPLDLPEEIKSLAINKTLAEVPNPVTYEGPGFGYPSAYQLPLVPAKNGKPFGTLAGKSLIASVSDNWSDTDDAVLSVRKSSNSYKTSTATDTSLKCNPSYLMITGLVNGLTTSSADVVVKLNVKDYSFRPTL